MVCVWGGLSLPLLLRHAKGDPAAVFADVNPKQPGPSCPSLWEGSRGWQMVLPSRRRMLTGEAILGLVAGMFPCTGVSR